jgi:thiosulfate/3-mercaptopyruvate sulfurtransferase
MKALFTILLTVCFSSAFAQMPINWTEDQLLEPSDLAATLKSGKNIPVIISVGPGATIPSSKDIGMIKEEENLKQFRALLLKLPRNTPVVVYCGCCPFDRCPNVRPAVDLLKELKFSDFKLLNLPHNIKTDWIDKGYPTE